MHSPFIPYSGFAPHLSNLSIQLWGPGCYAGARDGSVRDADAGGDVATVLPRGHLEPHRYRSTRARSKVGLSPAFWFCLSHCHFLFPPTLTLLLSISLFLSILSSFLPFLFVSFYFFFLPLPIV